jgi:predicted dehydrogenase
MAKIRAGIIGAGYFAEAVHLPALSRNGDIEMVAICRRHEAPLKVTAAKYGIPKSYTDYREMLAKEKLDAAYVLVSIDMTCEVATATMEAGIPTLLEKPPGKNSAEARKLCQVADRTGTLNIVAFNRRHSPMVRRAKDMIGSRKIRTASAKMLRFHRYEAEFVVGTGIHAIDTLRYLAGDVVEVETAAAEASDGKGGTNIVSVFHYASGAIGQLTIQTVSGVSDEQYEVHAQDASAFIVMPQGGFSDSVGRFEFWQGPTYPLKSYNCDVPDAYRGPGMMDGIFDEDADLVRHMRAGTRSANDVHDALKTVLVAEAIAKGGRQKVEKA